MYLPFTVKETSPDSKLVIKLPEVPWIKTPRRTELGENKPPRRKTWARYFKPKGSFHAFKKKKKKKKKNIYIYYKKEWVIKKLEVERFLVAIGTVLALYKY